MKKLCLLTTLIILCSMGSYALAADLDDVLAKHYETMGGLDKIKAVKTMKTTGTFMMQGMEFPYTTTHLRPSMIRVDVTAMGMAIVQAWDGESGWSIMPMSGSTDPQKMSGLEAKGFEMQADFDGPLVDWKDKGYTVELVGEDEIEGTAVYHLKVVMDEETTLDFYLDTEYYLTIMTRSKMTMEETEVIQETYLSDYEEVDGLVSARSIETRMGGVVQNQIQVTSVEYGIDVDESIFAMPEAAAAPTTGGDG